MTGENLLKHAKNIFRKRRSEYGEAREGFESVAKRWSLVLGQEVTPEQVVLCMVELKLTRLSGNPHHLDSMTDLAGYAAVLSELVPNQQGLFDER